MSEEGTTPTEAVAAPVEVIEDWRSGLSEELKGNASLQDFKDLNSLAEGFIHTKALVGNSLRPPGEDASLEDKQAFQQKLMDKNLGLIYKPDTTNSEAMLEHYKILGMPEDAGGYTQIEGIEAERFGQIAALAHAAGVSDKQMQTVLGEMVASDKAQFEISESERRVGLDQLKGEWGEAFDQKSARAAAVAKATNAPPALQEALGNGGVNADVLRWMDGLAASMGQEGSPLASQIGAVTSETKEELQGQFDEITRRLISKTETLSARESETLNKKRVDIMARLVA